MLAVKDESLRLGVPSFKLLGSAWALHGAVRRRAALPASRVLLFPELVRLVAHMRPTLCTASDGNHGRGVAALAERLGCQAVVFLPADTAEDRVRAIESHGARVQPVAGSYDETVAVARSTAGQLGLWYCPDTAGPDASAEERAFVGDVMEGYSTLFDELLSDLKLMPDVFFVQAGVGGLAGAAVLSLRAHSQSTRIVAVEPVGSACIQLSLISGTLCSVADVPTIMAGLRCQSVSAPAWPLLRRGLDAALTITDSEAEHSMRVLAQAGVEAGESGAAALAGALWACGNPVARDALEIDGRSIVAVVNTEGATDRSNYRRIVDERRYTDYRRSPGR
jgi:diaminopropionate ammonia-lyase